MPDDQLSIVGDEAGPADRAETADLVRRSEAAIEKLGEEARTVVVLRDIEGLSTKEVADLLDVTENVVKVRLHRAHAKLRELVLGNGAASAGGAA
jgi:RNA polymerase sigma-70 factor (ECF subfamily)